MVNDGNGYFGSFPYAQNNKTIKIAREKCNETEIDKNFKQKINIIQ